jgi:hypothetical protein
LIFGLLPLVSGLLGSGGLLPAYPLDRIQWKPPVAETEWTDDGASREERGLKHRAISETRSIPIPPGPLPHDAAP